jgi:hypothetical protein
MGSSGLRIELTGYPVLLTLIRDQMADLQRRFAPRRYHTPFHVKRCKKLEQA